MHERDWLIAVGILVIVAILLDGVRRVRNARRDSLQLSINMNRGIDNKEFDEYGVESTTSSIRVIDKRDDNVSRSKTASGAASPRTTVEPSLSDTARKRQIDFEKTAPLLMDVKEGRQARIEPGFASEDDEEHDDHDDTEESDLEELMDSAEGLDDDHEEDEYDESDEDDADRGSSSQKELVRTNPPARGVKNASPVFDTATTPLGLGESQIISEPRVFDRPADMPPPRREPPVIKPSKPVIKAIEERVQQQAAPPEKAAIAPKAKPAPRDVIIISVMARESAGFAGAAMLEILLANGLRYGHRSIFHRYTGEEREEESLFSVANAVKPGTFDLNSMESFHTPGITLFLPLPSPGGKALEAFDAMLATARAVAEQLNGDLRDDQRSALTGQIVEHYRQRIRDFEMQSRLHSR
jgi:cell division protein ZipA